MKNYKTDRAFLKKHLNIIELSMGDRRLLITPDLQGRVLTSTSNGDSGYSYGWLNYDLIGSGEFLPHCNNFGGEDRFWLGPEGGQYSLFFKSGSDFDFQNWQAPQLIDTEPWLLTESQPMCAKLSKEASLENYAGTELKMRLDRSIALYTDSQIESELGFDIPTGVDCVGFCSKNSLTNTGTDQWTQQTGMPSIWVLGQFIPSSQNQIVIPYNKCEQAHINDSYFGKIDADRMKISDRAIYFCGDGGKRGKIGIPPQMSTPYAAALDRANETLTIVKFSFDPTATLYVNSMWEHQSEPFKGDVINSYNDGPLEDGTIMGPFYEIETSSPALNLKPNHTHTHAHATFHVRGEISILEKLLEQIISR